MSFSLQLTIHTDTYAIFNVDGVTTVDSVRKRTGTTGVNVGMNFTATNVKV